jgi:hypothetical protein
MANDSVSWIRRFVCGMHGHDSLMHFQRGRLSLKCMSCGHESPGWDLRKSEAADAPSIAQAPERRRRLHFVSEFRT